MSVEFTSALDPLTRDDQRLFEELRDKAQEGSLTRPELAMYTLLEKVHAHAFRDELTGLYNRKVFNQVATKRYPRMNRPERSILVIDIDDFKQVNTRYGHQAGDAVLRSVAETIASCLRDEDIAIRYAGDEFCVIAANANLQGAYTIAKRIHDRVKKAPIRFEGHDISVSVSIGYTEVKAGLLKAFAEADAALLGEAKGAKGTGTTIAAA